MDITMVNGTLGLGDYVLMTYGSLSGNASNLQMTEAAAASRYTFAINTSVSPNVVLTVGGSDPLGLTWTGDGAGNVWDLTNTMNWNGNSEKFYNLDTVRFDDTSAQTSVNLAGTLHPAGVTVDSANNYTFSGSGKLSGAGGLIKLGTGSLSILNANDYTGATASQQRDGAGERRSGQHAGDGQQRCDPEWARGGYSAR